MTRKEMTTWNEKANFGTIADELNPAFIFSGISSSLLADIIAGKIDAVEIAKRTLENRGQNEAGKWVGFNQEIK